MEDDWELLHDDFDDGDSFPQLHSSHSNSTFFHLTDSDSPSPTTTILSDYFSLPIHHTYSISNTPPKSSSLIMPCLLDSENLNNTGTNSLDCLESATELGSESSNRLFDDPYEFNQSHANNLTDTCFEEITTVVENLDTREADDGELSGSAFVAKDDPLSANNMYNPMMESEESCEESESQDEVLEDSNANANLIGNESAAIMKSGDSDHIDSVNDILDKEDGDSNEKTNLAIEEVKVEAKSGEVEAERKRVVWWKVPFQVLRYCLLRASPAWSFSVAVAFMGMVILGRRLYKMKRKTKSLLLKIAVDDKKASQFADRAARLNEAFSLVRRVPVVRASLAGAGANSWPAMSMR